MFGFRFVKFEPGSHVFVIKKGKVVREGQALSFWYYAPSTSFIQVPAGSNPVPFLFEEMTTDFQTVTIQGELIYHIAAPEKIKQHINFSIDSLTLHYLSEEPSQLSQRIVNILKTITKREVEKITLKAVIKAGDLLQTAMTVAMATDSYLASLGLSVTNISILSIVPSADTSRALEAGTREVILKEADDAIYVRRNASVEQERTIKENELNTEIAIETKKRQIRETQVEAERSVKEKERVLIAEESAFRIQQEKEKKMFVELNAENLRLESDARAYSLQVLLKVFEGMDPEVLRTLSQTGMKPEQLIASAFEGLAKNAGKIGELNVSPDLLNSLLNRKS